MTNSLEQRIEPELEQFLDSLGKMSQSLDGKSITRLRWIATYAMAGFNAITFVAVSSFLTPQEC